MSNGLEAPLLTDEYNCTYNEPILMPPLSSTQHGKDKTFDYLFKLILVGDAGVGKSSILERFVDNTSNDAYVQTIGVDFKIKTMFVDNIAIKLQIWDTTGQERFRSITSSYYKGSHIFFVIFDVTDIKSFKNVTKHFMEIEQCANHQNLFGKILIGNKIDLEDNRVVQFDEAKKIANSADIQYMETSAKTGFNLEQIFKYAAQNAVIKKKELDKLISIETMSRHSTTSTAKSASQNVSGCCCCTVL